MEEHKAGKLRRDIQRKAQSNGSTYIYDRLSAYDSESKKYAQVATKLIGKLPAGKTDMKYLIPTRPKLDDHRRNKYGETSQETWEYYLHIYEEQEGISRRESPASKSQGNEPRQHLSQHSTSFRDKVAVITGGAQGIGKCIAEEFAKRGAHVCIIDIQDNPYFVGDLSMKKDLECFAAKVSAEYGRVDYLINNAAPLMKGITECTYEEFEYAQRVGVTAAFYLSKLFLPIFTPGGSIINISSSRDRMSQPETESYTTAKGGIAALTHALAASLAGKVRVNSISPGWIDTSWKVYEGPDAVQQPEGRVGNPLDIANLVLFLCSEQAGFITGENITVDGGMTKLMIYHGDHGWEYHP